MHARVLVGVLILAASGGCNSWHKAIATTPHEIDRLAIDSPGQFLRDTGEPITGPWDGIETDGREAGEAAAPVTVELWMDYQTAAAPVADGQAAEPTRQADLEPPATRPAGGKH